ncbi:MAG: c-type cytochrome [Legionellaceae bacterium]|nr:c-type cytochrome [Legionellaceae bacterium]
MKQWLYIILLCTTTVFAETNTVATVGPQTGQQVYEQHCALCHTTGVAGAPKFRDMQDWKQRVAGKKLAELTQTALQGKNAMPPKGTCMQCDEALLQQAIEYMLPPGWEK